MLIYKYSQLNCEIDYYDTEKIRRKIMDDKHRNYALHLGQLKLFLSELLFLSKNAKDGDIIIYIGAAPGYHLNKLVDMFPKCHFELWDPRQSDVRNKQNVTIHEAKFTHESIAYYKEPSERYLLITDLRNMVIGRAIEADDIKEADTIATDDMVIQMEWCQMLKPRKAYLKFRLPYEIRTLEYLSGTIYLQPFGPVSTEARLSTSDYHTLVKYDSFKFDRMLACHNVLNRSMLHNNPAWCGLTRKHRIINTWDTIFALYIIHLYVVKVKKITVDTRKKSMELYLDIISFMRKRSGRYDQIFEK